MSQIGKWDLGTGKPIRANRNANGSALSYNILQCKPMAAPSQLNFNGHIFDLRSGKVDDQLVFDGAVRTRHGRQIGWLLFRAINWIYYEWPKSTKPGHFNHYTAIYFNQAVISYFIYGALTAPHLRWCMMTIHMRGFSGFKRNNAWKNQLKAWSCRR